VAAFPAVAACPETLPGGPIEVPEDHPIVRQTVEDCLTEAMDCEGFLAVLRGLADGSIERHAIDTPEPSAFARGILSSAPYTFLDDAPLEERRTQAVMSRRILDIRTADELGALDPAAVERVREEAWPHPQDAEELHEALLWMGYVAAHELGTWGPWITELALAGRAVREGDRWFAVEASRDPKLVLRGRLEATGPIVVAPASDDEALLLQLESEGVVMRARIGGETVWCDRRLLARIQRYTLDRLRREIEPVTPSQFLQFLACWQHVDPGHRLEGPGGVAEVVEQLAGFEVPAAAWEDSVLPARVHGYRREWLDQLTLGGTVAWGRLWGAAQTPVRRSPIALVPREQLESWACLASATVRPELGTIAKTVLEVLRSHGASFVPEIVRAAKLPLVDVEDGLAELVAGGWITCDSFGGLRSLLSPAWTRRHASVTTGRWSLLDRRVGEPDRAATDAEFVARRLLRRTGVVFRKTLARERIPLLWRDIARACRDLERRGELRGGRFVAGFDGEQYALPDAIAMLRRIRRTASQRPDAKPSSVCAADPLNFQGILTPDERIPADAPLDVRVG
jgi:ATP-dependent Lhr-like helicase